MNITLQDFSKRIGINSGRMSFIERGMRILPDEFIPKINEELNCDIIDVFLNYDFGCEETYAPPPKSKRKKSYNVGIANSSAYFNSKQIREIRRQYDSKEKTVSQIAKELGVRYNTIRSIVLRISYKDVP